MHPASAASALSRPSWDGTRVRFEILDGAERVQCAISQCALQDLSPRRSFSKAEMLLCFEQARATIEAVARTKLEGRSVGVTGTLSIWADDLDELPPTTTPAAMQKPPGGRQG